MKGYLVRRKSEAILKHGLVRRTEAIIQQLQPLGRPKPWTVLDVGTADGLLLYGLMGHYGLGRCIGIDIRLHYLRAAKENVPHVAQADGKRLPFRENSVDVVISTAVFKHVRGLENLIRECHRVLKPGGRFVITDPTPLAIRLGMLLGYFSSRSIIQILSLKDVQQMLTECGFKVAYAGYFMLSPVSFAGSHLLEGALKRMHLGQLLLNHIVSAECCTLPEVAT
jgi:SAM-dependent methyltransferase